MKCQSDTQSRKYTSSTSTFDAWPTYTYMYAPQCARTSVRPPFMNPLSSGGLDDGTFYLRHSLDQPTPVRSVTFNLSFRE